ncbi:MAG: FliI/YscN family ATPase [Phycisphaerae bacterium]
MTVRATSHSNTRWFEPLAEEIHDIVAERTTGRVDVVRGLGIIASGLPARIGAVCGITTSRGREILAEVVGVQSERTHLTAYEDLAGVATDDDIVCQPAGAAGFVGHELLGRVIDALGRPLDGKPPPRLTHRAPLHRDPPPPLQRREIDEPLSVGIRAIDGMLSVGRGQRIGLFAGTGVGKSVLLGMICRNTEANMNVVALIGERGREVGDFVREQLGQEGLARSVVVVSSSDEAPALRIRACRLATAIAEYFRDEGNDVLLMMDSLTRVAMAQRQIGLAAGEPPTMKGYPPSTFSLLPQLLERAGRTQGGSITGIYTVLVEGDDLDEPISDAARGILDGHVVLSRKLANQGHYPAIDVLSSISRVADALVTREQQVAVRHVRSLLATWRDMEDLVSIGAYVRGANPEYDAALAAKSSIQSFLRQSRDERSEFDMAQAQLSVLSREFTTNKPAGGVAKQR